MTGVRTVRAALATATTEALAAHTFEAGDLEWLVIDKVPANPDDLVAWVRWPRLARRGDLKGGLAPLDIPLTWCVSLDDPDSAQEIIDGLYDTRLWSAIEKYIGPPRPWRSCAADGLEEPYQLTLADGAQMLAADLVFRILPLSAA